MGSRFFLCAVFALSAALPARADPAAESEARRLLAAHPGDMLVMDVRSGAIVASLNGEAPVLPLSLVKLFIAASYWEHRGRSRAAMDPHALVALGIDAEGKRLAIALRRALGSEAVLADLARFGFPRCTARRSVDCTTLSAATPDADWASALSIGESGFRVTPLGMSRFLLAAGRGGVAANGARMLRAETARNLQAAMRDTVDTGTAAGIKTRLHAGWRIGGKTGTGPAAQTPYDGCFAGLVFDAQDRPRYAFAVYLPHTGHGGGAAAQTAADMANFLSDRH